MPTETETLEAQLTEAKSALHKLMMGTKVVKIDYDGGSTEYSRTSASELRRYITSLNRQLGNSPKRAGSQRVIF